VVTKNTSATKFIKIIMKIQCTSRSTVNPRTAIDWGQKVQHIDLHGVIENRSHTHKSGEIFHAASQIKGLCYMLQSIAELGLMDTHKYS